ncbi:MAG: hypothetical protein FWE31_01990 [Firmicutes bacterium]|nr:hypothetical protein [Bacillota bacterium]
MFEMMVEEVKSRLHDNWRIKRLQKDGTFQPRWKPIEDRNFIDELQGYLPPYVRQVEGGYEIDIANASFDQLSKDWQHENQEAAKRVVEEIILAMDIDGHRFETDEIGDIIHEYWLERNKRARGGDLDVPYSELPVHEQDKDLDQFHMGRAVYDEMVDGRKIRHSNKWGVERTS